MNPDCNGNQRLLADFAEEAWNAFGVWLDQWRAAHPEDDRSDWELCMEEYGNDGY